MRGVRVKYSKEVVADLIEKGYTLKMLGDLYNVPSSSVGRALKKLGIKYNLQTRKISKVEDFFKEIDTELKAYLLGFFTADGCVYDNSRFGLCISAQDEYIVELFKQSIAPDSFVKRLQNSKGAKNRQPQLTLRISSTVVVSDLAKYGVKPRKTWSCIRLPKLDEDLTWHYIRGYFDGNGHLGIRKCGKYNTLRINLTMGGSCLLQDIQTFVKAGRLYQPKNKNYWKLDIENIVECRDLLYKMYKNATYKLPRKYSKFLQANTEVIAQSKKCATP